MLDILDALLFFPGLTK